MPEIFNQAVESFTQIPDGLEHPLQTAAVLGGTAVALVAQNLHYRFSSEKQAAPFSNHVLLESSIQPSRAVARRSRMWPVYGELLGGGLILTSVLGSPAYETEAPNHNANVVVVQDESFSMLNTADLGDSAVSRAQATGQALSTVDYQGNLGLIQVGADSRITIPLGKFQPQEISTSKPQVDPNGGKLVQAMDLAASLFPVADHKITPDNTEVIVTDGTVDDTAGAITAEAAKLHEKGINIKFVVPGTAKGTYKLPDSTVPVASGTEASRFAGVPSNSVIEAKSVSEVTAAIHKDIHASGITHNKHRWLVPGVLGVLLAGAGILTDQIQRPRRVV